MTPPPLVFVCGVGSDADSWRHQHEALGGAVLIPQGDTIEAMAAGVLARMPERAALAGHSMGGYVALAVQRMAPARVDRLALLNTSAAPDSQEQKAGREALVDALEKHGLERLTAALVRPVSDDPQLQARLRAMFARAGVDRVIREQRACAARPDARTGLETIDVPTLVIASLDDAIIPPGAVETLARGIPHARVVRLETGGHVTAMAHPDSVTEEMRGWLA